MRKYKICPSCKAKNAPALFECIHCEADLTGIKITDEETEAMNTANAAAKPEERAKLFRLCDCGVKNAPNARVCSACGEDISDVAPTPDTQEAPAETTFVLSSLDGRYAYKVTRPEVILGRENVMHEYLTAKVYVSRAHAKLYLSEGKLYIENLSGTNFTYVNNQKTAGRVELQDGDEIGLGGTNINGKCQEQAAYFLVRIGSCM